MKGRDGKGPGRGSYIDVRRQVSNTMHVERNIFIFTHVRHLERVQPDGVHIGIHSVSLTVILFSLLVSFLKPLPVAISMDIAFVVDLRIEMAVAVAVAVVTVIIVSSPMRVAMTMMYVQSTKKERTKRLDKESAPSADKIHDSDIRVGWIEE